MILLAENSRWPSKCFIVVGTAPFIFIAPKNWLQHAARTSFHGLIEEPSRRSSVDMTLPSGTYSSAAFPTKRQKLPTQILVTSSYMGIGRQ